MDDDRVGQHLRLVWPQWQGAGTGSVRDLAPEFPFDIARRGYAVGSAVLAAILPEHRGPTAVVPVEMGDVGLEERDGIEASGGHAAAPTCGRAGNSRAIVASSSGSKASSRLSRSIAWPATHTSVTAPRPAQ